MYTLGEKLRSHRLAKGIELSAIAEETRISSRYLQALEAGDRDVLPGSIFAKSFARQYATFVGLDESEIEAELQESFPPEDNLPSPDSVQPRSPIQLEPLPDAVGAHPSFRPQVYRSAIGLLLVVAACTGAFVGWQRWMTPAADEPRPLAREPRTEAPPPQDTPSRAAPAQPTMEPASHGSEPTPANAAAIELNVPGGDPSGMAVRLVATETTWVSITVNGHSVFRGTLKPNEVRTLSGVARANLVIGNAGGVDVIADGKSIGPIGPPGHVRQVVLTPDGPQILRNVDTKKSGPEGRS